jgi:zinc/manganese transport system substrate-binding protein
MKTAKNRMGQLFCGLAFTILCSSPVLAQEFKVVASFSIIGDMVREVGGNLVSVTTLVRPDEDAHVYEPTPEDARSASAARIIFFNGLGFEGWFTRLLEASETRAALVEVSLGIKPLAPDEHQGNHEHESDHDSDGVNPHAWQDVANAIVYVQNIANGLCAADAQHCDAYRSNAARYIRSLEDLDHEIRQMVEKIPPDRRRVITTHEAFSYFEHAYGIDFLAAEGVSTESEASAADVANLIEQVRHDKAAALFVENITDPRLIEQISRETGLAPGGALYSDALSKAGGPATTYIDMMRHNAQTIASAIDQGS